MRRLVVAGVRSWRMRHVLLVARAVQLHRSDLEVSTVMHRTLDEHVTWMTRHAPDFRAAGDLHPVVVLLEGFECAENELVKADLQVTAVSYRTVVDRLRHIMAHDGLSLFRRMHSTAFRLLIGAAFLLLLVLLADFLPVGPYISTCDYNPYARHTNPDQTGTALVHISVRDAVSFGVPRAILLLLFAAAVWFAPHQSRLRTAVWLLVPVAAFFAGLQLLVMLKHQLGDVACHVRPNSVSGHMYVFVYAVVLTLYLARVAERHAVIYTALPLILTGLGTAAAAFNALFTFLYGYHSLRQMLLGAVLGLAVSALSILCTEWLLEYEHMRQRRERLAEKQGAPAAVPLDLNAAEATASAAAALPRMTTAEGGKVSAVPGATGEPEPGRPRRSGRRRGKQVSG